LDVIVDELGLPGFRVPTPRNSAEHRSATLYRSHPPAPPQRHPTRHLTRGPEDWEPAESYGVPGQFAGIDMTAFHYERQRAKRALLLWIAVVLIVTGTVAAAAWNIGSNIGGLI
jgi:serine/threonine protein kinase, bacterial